MEAAVEIRPLRFETALDQGGVPEIEAAGRNGENGRHLRVEGVALEPDLRAARPPDLGKGQRGREDEGHEFARPLHVGDRPADLGRDVLVDPELQVRVEPRETRLQVGRRRLEILGRLVERQADAAPDGIRVSRRRLRRVAELRLRVELVVGQNEAAPDRRADGPGHFDPAEDGIEKHALDRAFDPAAVEDDRDDLGRAVAATALDFHRAPRTVRQPDRAADLPHRDAAQNQPGRGEIRVERELAGGETGDEFAAGGAPPGERQIQEPGQVGGIDLEPAARFGDRRFLSRQPASGLDDESRAVDDEPADRRLAAPALDFEGDPAAEGRGRERRHEMRVPNIDGQGERVALLGEDGLDAAGLDRAGREGELDLRVAGHPALDLERQGEKRPPSRPGGPQVGLRQAQDGPLHRDPQGLLAPEKRQVGHAGRDPARRERGRGGTRTDVVDDERGGENGEAQRSVFEGRGELAPNTAEEDVLPDEEGADEEQGDEPEDDEPPVALEKPHAGIQVRARPQSFRNFSRPRSVSGWRTSFSMTAKGTVAICAPMSAASMTCRGWRTEATMTSVVKS